MCCREMYQSYTIIHGPVSKDALDFRPLPKRSSAEQEVNALNRLALEGVLAVIESISRRCGPSSSRTPPLPSSKQHHQQHPGGWAQAAGSPPVPASLSGGPSSEGLSASLGGPDSSRRDSVSDSDSDQEYIAAFGGGGVPRGIMGGEGDTTFSEGAGGGSTVWGVGELGWLERARARTAEVLQERKKMKRRLGLAARKFNSGSKGWLEYAQVGWGRGNGLSGIMRFGVGR